MGGVHGGVHLAMGSPIAPVRSPEVLAPCIRGVWANRGGDMPHEYRRHGGAEASREAHLLRCTLPYPYP